MNSNEVERGLNDTWMRTWTWPFVLGVTSAVGLVSALLADGWADVLAWFGLGLPVLVACAYGSRRKPVGADYK